MKTGDLVRIIATGNYAIIIDPYAELQPGPLGYVSRVLTSNSGYFFMYWDEMEKICEAG